MILVTGASGTVGSAVLEELSKTAKPFKAMYRSEDEAKKAGPGVSPVVADFAKKDTLRTALAGVETVFLVCAPIPQLVELESNVIDACMDNDVSHLVLFSALGAGDYAKSFPSWHRKVEDRLKSTGLGYTILRPNGFMQNIVAFNAPTIRTQNAFYAAMGNARVTLIDLRDIAAVAAKIMASPAQHSGKIYELSGPEPVSNADIADRISRAVGRKVSYVDIPEEAQRKAMLDAGMPEWQVTALLELQQYYKAGKAQAANSVLSELLGQPPRKLDNFLQESKDAFAQETAAGR